MLDGDSALPCGAVADVTKTGFSVQTGSGLLRILELQIPGKKAHERGRVPAWLPDGAGDPARRRIDRNAYNTSTGG